MVSRNPGTSAPAGSPITPSIRSAFCSPGPVSASLDPASCACGAVRARTENHAGQPSDPRRRSVSGRTSRCGAVGPQPAGRSEVTDGMECRQREFLLRQRLAAIEKELGKDGDDDVIEEYRRRIARDGLRRRRRRFVGGRAAPHQPRPSRLPDRGDLSDESLIDVTRRSPEVPARPSGRDGPGCRLLDIAPLDAQAASALLVRGAG
jgi:hypothetical protein